MRDPCIPHPSDDREAVIDLAGADLLWNLPGALEEYHDDDVLALGSDLCEAHRIRRRQTRVSHETQHLVLVLGEATNGRKWLLVLEAPVHDRARELVPPI